MRIRRAGRVGITVRGDGDTNVARGAPTRPGGVSDGEAFTSGENTIRCKTDPEADGPDSGSGADDRPSLQMYACNDTKWCSR